MTEARGSFDIQRTPIDTADNQCIGGFALAKSFSGDLQGSSVGQMLAIGTETPGSAGYVAMERVTGTLAGRSGSFALQHYGLMNRGVPSLVIDIVPDSGTGDVAGISGTMEIVIDGGQHNYVLRYELV